MSTEELSNEFDTLVNSYSSELPYGSTNNALAFDEYEKSVFLTSSQEDCVRELYASAGYGVESTEEHRRYLANLIRTKVYDGNESNEYELPDNLWFIIGEKAFIKNSLCDECALVMPVTRDEYAKTVRNPFRGPTKRRVLRVDYDGYVKLVTDGEITHYELDYLVEPRPIVLADFDGVSVNGVSEKTDCELTEALHRPILERAVRKAIQSRITVKQQ